MPSGCQALTVWIFQGGLEGKAKALVAVTHLALLGVREQEAAFWASVTEEEGSPSRGCSFECLSYDTKNCGDVWEGIWTETDRTGTDHRGCS